MTKNELSEKLESMKGGLFKNAKDHKVHRFISYKITGEDFQVVTDLDWYVKHISEAWLFLSSFTEESDNGERGITIIKNSPVQQKEDPMIANMTALIKENIEKLKADKGYLEVARETNSQVKTLIELAKLQMLKNSPKGQF